MKRASVALVCLSTLAWSARASAEEPRVHVAAGGAHAIGGTQESEFGTGGTGSGTVEIPATSRVGVQATAGAFALAKGENPKDATIQPTSAGSVFLGTLGVRLRAYGATRVAGPWIDGNVGVAHTGDLTRPAFDAHLGWDVRVSKTSRIDIGPFVGYTQVFQPDSSLRGSDARILSAGIAFSLGAKERAKPVEPTGVEQPLPPPPPPPPPAFEEHDGLAEAVDICKDGEIAGDDGCGDGVRIFEDRILLEDVVHFDFDSARIRANSHPLVRKIAFFIATHPDIVDISIEGHADEVGTEEYNQKLSEDRARSMRQMLIWFGVSSSRLRVVAHGKSMPKIVTLKAEYQNRRVELFITREREEARAGSATTTHGRNSQ